jgi:glutamate racemase
LKNGKFWRDGDVLSLSAKEALNWPWYNVVSGKDCCLMRSDARPIGFLDSGVGGLTVIKEFVRQLPNESYLFIGDQARMPYGPRPAEQVQQFAWQLTQFLLQFDVKMVVFACNTATAEALPLIRKLVDIPIVGVIPPGVRAAIRATRNGHIGVIGTVGTIRSHAYDGAIQAQAPEIEVSTLAAPKFVPVVESNQYHSPVAKKIVAETLQQLPDKDIDTLVLGCTHYPLLRPLIQNYMGKHVTLIDSGAETVSEISALLDYFDIRNLEHGPQSAPKLFTTGSPKMFGEIAEDWLRMTDLPVTKVNVTDLPAANGKEMVS